MGQILNAKPDTPVHTGRKKRRERRAVVKPVAKSDKRSGEAVKKAGNEQETLTQGAEDKLDKSKGEADSTITTETTNDAARGNATEEDTNRKIVEKVEQEPVKCVKDTTSADKNEVEEKAVENAGNEEENLIQGKKEKQDDSKVEADSAIIAEPKNDVANENGTKEDTDSKTVETEQEPVKFVEDNTSADMIEIEEKAVENAGNENENLIQAEKEEQDNTNVEADSGISTEPKNDAGKEDATKECTDSKTVETADQGPEKSVEDNASADQNEIEENVAQNADNEEEILTNGGKDKQDDSKVEADSAITTEVKNETVEQNATTEDTNSKTVEKAEQQPVKCVEDNTSADTKETEEIKSEDVKSAEEKDNLGTIVIILTQHNELGNTGKQTGWNLPELAHPLEVISNSKKKYNLIFASLNGGKTEADEGSLEEWANDECCAAFLKSDDYERTKNTVKYADIDMEGVSCVFYPGGHGPMWDLADDKDAASKTAAFYEGGGLVVAVCHGQAALVPMILGNGNSILDGKVCTGTTNNEEEIMKLTEDMPFALETRMKELGGKFKNAEAWKPCVVVDGNLITGQNPASGTPIGEAIVDHLSERRREISDEAIFYA